GEYSLARIELLTGRTHQARVHAAHIGHPILGDRKYGDFNANRAMKSITRPLLHAYELGFPEDIDESLEEISGRNFVAELPDDMKYFTEKRFNIKK
ncbi:MAG: RNA pseudouridine synthase, partial [Synergistaceae bacterium]|nr:RNA pseudouridine synthase [Synergistaceae bacterium]